MHEGNNFYHDPWAEAHRVKQQAKTKQAAEEAERHRETYRRATSTWRGICGSEFDCKITTGTIESSHDVGIGLAARLNKL
jgi:hypothetical protein